jgi:hypothetical protein
MDDYLLYLEGGCPPAGAPPELLVGLVVHLLGDAPDPVAAGLAEGDRLWWVDADTGEVAWELRARAVVSRPYSHLAEALAVLRRTYGLLPSRWNDYFADAPHVGHLLSFAVDVVQPVAGARVPPRAHQGRTGLSKVDDTLRATVGLTPSTEAPLVPCPRTFDVATVTRVDAADPELLVPAPVRVAAWHRDDGTCRRCRTALDAARARFVGTVWGPLSGRDGTDVQVLCGMCAGSAADDPGVAAEPVEQLAGRLGRQVPRSADTLVDLLGAALGAGEFEAVEVVVVAVSRDEQISGADLGRCVDVLANVPGATDRVRLMRAAAEAAGADAELRALVPTARPAVGDLACLLLASGDAVDSAVRPQLLARAARSADTWVADGARLLLAHASRDVGVLAELATVPSLRWRSEAALALAGGLFDEAVAGDDERRAEFLARATCALASPDARVCVDAALLLCAFWLDVDLEGPVGSPALDCLQLAFEFCSGDQLDEAELLLQRVGDRMRTDGAEGHCPAEPGV